MKNNYSSFTEAEDMQKELHKVSSKNDIMKGGIPLCYDDKSLYIDEEYGHSLVIGNTGSGKTQTTILPRVFTSINSHENIIVDDAKGEIYKMFENDLKSNDYKIIKFDFQEFNENGWNPLKLPFKLYKEGNIDDAVMLLEKSAYYLFTDSSNGNADPFWINCVRQLFAGIALYIMEKEDRIPTIIEISNYANKITMEDFNNLDDESPAKVFLRIIMTAPTDTSGSIFSVFNNLIMVYAIKNKISDFLSNNDFEMESILDERVALFIIDGHKKPYITNLISLFIEELYYVCDKRKNSKKLNIVLDDFQDFDKIDSLAKLLSDTRYINMEFTILVNSLHRLSEIYGETSLEHIIAYFIRIIYLFANDEFTLDYISNMCGNKNANEKLISSTELKLLEQFEAVILKNRQLPFKTQLLPFYQYKIK